MSKTDQKTKHESDTVTCSADVLIEQLKKTHSPAHGWEFVGEMRCGTGYGGGKEQRFDGWAIQAWARGGVTNLRRSFEVKVSASDLRSELLNTDKRWFAEAFSHEFYFVCPKGLCKKEWLKNDEGLMEWDGEELRITKRATRRNGMPPKWDFVASLVRSLKKQNAQVEPSVGSTDKH